MTAPAAAGALFFLLAGAFFGTEIDAAGPSILTHSPRPRTNAIGLRALRGESNAGQPLLRAASPSTLATQTTVRREKNSWCQRG